MRSDPVLSLTSLLRRLSRVGLGACAATFLLVSGCKDTAKISATQATAHVAMLAETAQKDVAEVRSGLPQGAELMGAAIAADATVRTDPKAAAEALRNARRKVQDLRMAKSTFFALADEKGIVIRNDQEQDRMVGKPLFASYPRLSEALSHYVETTGSMPEAAGVRAPRADAQWVAGVPAGHAGAVSAIYVSGWSWSSYAYRLEFALRGQIRTELASKPGENEPLVYVFVVVGDDVYGTPVSPEVSRSAVSALHPLSKIKGDETWADKVDITGRSYGVAVKKTPILGDNVGIAVLRSET